MIQVPPRQPSAKCQPEPLPRCPAMIPQGLVKHQISITFPLSMKYHFFEIIPLIQIPVAQQIRVVKPQLMIPHFCYPLKRWNLQACLNFACYSIGAPDGNLRLHQLHHLLALPYLSLMQNLPPH